uniref:ATP synthase F0 subunit 8 n=1 Tax=Colobopsis nipponica TaxID=2681982 RepID=A0A7S6XY08_9HYME|nr:ATP synthase F0 subunit 8 [Colobopsis nipponica]QOW83449.1 ATP synthase F0 subunit 8 [Colobopsis nipponica]
MPHMMPMMWTLIFLSTLIILYIIMNLIYFFYIPSLNTKMFNKIQNRTSLIKWMWKW